MKLIIDQKILEIITKYLVSKPFIEVAHILGSHESDQGVQMFVKGVTQLESKDVNAKTELKSVEKEEA